jgi:hypothetical protein
MPSVTYNPLMQNVVMLNVVMVSVVMLSVVAPVTGTPLALSSHIRLAWKKMSETTTLDYFRAKKKVSKQWHQWLVL